jgi:hypothetical protein
MADAKLPLPDIALLPTYALTFDRVGMAVLLSCLLRTVAAQEARVAGEHIVRLRDDLHNEVVANELPAGGGLYGFRQVVVGWFRGSGSW